jgi:hypothetical protein
MQDWLWEPRSLTDGAVNVQRVVIATQPVMQR